MRCPYCSGMMEKGLIESSEPINFMKKVKFVNRANEKKGEINLAKPPFGGRAHVEAWICRNCRRIEIVY